MLKAMKKWIYDQKFKRLRARYERETFPPPSDVPETFFYVHWKAWKFKTVGPSKYRAADAFGRPPEDWSADRLEAVKQGCEQISMWRGLTPNSALEGLGISTFYDMLHLFHFSLKQQSATRLSSGVMLDKMEMQHVMTSELTTLFNEVVS